MKDLFKMQAAHTRWASFENPKAGKGCAGHENNKAKGHAFEKLAAGASVDLLEYDGAGIITRMWLTVSDRSPEMLRSLVLRCWWDGADRPAVEVPFGDFFSCGSRLCAFENELFSSPEGRSFNSFVPMPFRKSAKISVTNESGTDLTHIFYELNMLAQDEPDSLYLHCYWNRDKRTAPGEDYTALPKIAGKGRILGAAFEVNTGKCYGRQWWGEGEVKIYIDGDGELPTLCGTGTEDYIGTGWSQGVYANRYQGCTSADWDSGNWIFYRLHIADPVYFHSDIKYEIQVIGGAPAEEVRAAMAQGAPVIPVSGDVGGVFQDLYKSGKPMPESGWVNYYRSDDFASTVWFYLDRAESGLPELAPMGERV